MKGRCDYLEYIANMVYYNVLPGVLAEIVAEALYDIINPIWPLPCRCS